VIPDAVSGTQSGNALPFAQVASLRQAPAHERRD
jgi:hypothetical protein